MKLPLIEPYFKTYAFMRLNDYNKLRNYERKLHAGHDTMKILLKHILKETRDAIGI